MTSALALSPSQPSSLSFEDFHREHLRVLTNKLFKQVHALEQEVRERHQAEEKFRYLAYYDPVTGLPNRLHFMDLLTQAIEHAVADGSCFAMFFLDLDALRDTISRFGYERGDWLLKSVAQRLQDSARPLLIAYLGSNLFALLTTPVRGEAEAKELARHLQQEVAALMDTADYQEIFLTTQLGGVLFPRDGKTATTLLQHAHSALSQAKLAGKNSIRFFDHRSLERLHARVSLATQLRRALDRQEFVVYYQPKIELPTFRVTGVEALLRWQKPDQGLVSPGVFISLAEDTRLILPLSEWCLREACRQWGRWRQLKLPPLRMAVNMSSRQFEDSSLTERYAAILADTGMDPTCLDLEITESVLLLGVELVQHGLRTLQELGCSFSLDDFGTGYSSLSYLKTLPLSVLKIDQAFVHQLAVDKKDAAITALIIEMAHTLGLTVVAEGVETVEQVSALERYGCDELQGYYITRPLAAEALTRFLQSERLALLKGEVEAHTGARNQTTEAEP